MLINLIIGRPGENPGGRIMATIITNTTAAVTATATATTTDVATATVIDIITAVAQDLPAPPDLREHPVQEDLLEQQELEQLVPQAILVQQA
jgi:hypothetical protein